MTISPLGVWRLDELEGRDQDARMTGPYRVGSRVFDSLAAAIVDAERVHRETLERNIARGRGATRVLVQIKSTDGQLAYSIDTEPPS